MRYVGGPATATPAPWGPVSGWTIARSGSNPTVPTGGSQTRERHVPSAVRIAAGNLWIYHKGALDIMASKSTDEGVTSSYQNSDTPVVSRGAGGTWDHDYVVEPFVLYNASANTLHMFYKGSPGVSGNGVSIGHATASDSAPQTWTKDGANPILKAQDISVALSGGTVAIPDLSIGSVIKIGSTWHFYGYINYGGTYSLFQCTGATMTTPDATTVEILSHFNGDALFETPSVLVEPDGSYLMLYTSGPLATAGRTIYSATSPDGETWTGQPGTVLAPTGSGWEKDLAYSGQFVRANAEPYAAPYIDGSGRSLFFYSGGNLSTDKYQSGLAYITLV